MLAFIPPATRALLLANVGVYLLQLLVGPPLIEWFALWPGSQFEPWQLLSYAFLHDTSSALHILVNMFALFTLGAPLERSWAAPRFLLYYCVCVLAAGLTQMTVAGFEQSSAPTIGASGGIFGLLLGFAVYFPRERLMLLFLPIPLPAWAFVTIYGLLELFFGVTGRQADVAHFAHLGGLLGGAVMILFWRGKDRMRVH